MSAEATQETIAAIATGAGAGGVGVIRVSGPRAIEIVSGVVGLAAEKLDRTVRYAVARDGAGARLDDVIVFAMRAPRSFTGEDVAELQGHGGPVNLAKLLRAVLERGARVAEPGEFSRRAFENGKLDLLRAEALLGVIEAGSERAWRIAQSQLAGSLGQRLAGLEERARGVLAELEGAIDFPEEDLEEQGGQWLRGELAALAKECADLVRSYHGGAALRSGITVALVGATNVGKSSLLNALVGRDRALVSATPGTTRDYLEAQVEWQGVKVTLVDTAGWRSSSAGAAGDGERGGDGEGGGGERGGQGGGDEIERAGIDLGRARADEADVVLVISDGEQGEIDGARFGRRAVRVRSKADLQSGTESGTGLGSGTESGTGSGSESGTGLGSGSESGTGLGSGSESGTGLGSGSGTGLGSGSGSEWLATSARTGQGMAELKLRVLELMGISEAVGDGELLVTERQRRLAETAQHAFERAGAALQTHPRELVAYDIREGYKSLMEMRGTEVEDQLVDEIFARFCIGK